MAEKIMNLDILVYIFTVGSLVCNGILFWYIRKLMELQENLNTELLENINVFQGELETLLDTEVLSGEPTLMKLMDDIREFGSNTEEIRLRLIPNENEEKEEKN
jgi:hypothetical protein